MLSMAILEVSALVKRYGRVTAVDQVDFDVQGGVEVE